MAFCENCGEKLAAGLKFCTSCGTAVPQPAASPTPAADGYTAWMTALEDEGEDDNYLAEVEALVQRYLRKKGKNKNALTKAEFEECKTTADGIFEYMGEGIDSFSDGDLESAVNNFTEALQLDDSYAAAYKMRSLCKARQEDVDGTKADLDTALRLAPEDGELYFMLGDFYRITGEYNEAVKNYSQAISHDYAVYEVYKYRGGSYAVAGEKQKALEDFKTASQFKGDDGEIAYQSEWEFFFLRGGARGNTKEAIEDLDAALELLPVSLPAEEAVEQVNMVKGFKAQIEAALK
jgi:tetratricopeptide (TPR) repeat protein